MLGKSNIFLIGPMGAGKTAVGRHLARVLARDFHDSDVEIERRTGVDIPYVFEKEGETGFRQREREALEYLTGLEPIVLATGGGAVLSVDNRRFLKERGCVVYLQTSVSQQFERTRHGHQRPLLLNTDPRARLQELLRQREPLYLETADITVGTDARRVAVVADEILQRLNLPPGPGVASEGE